MQEVQSERAAHSALGCGVPEQVAQVHGAPRRITQSEKMDVPSPQNILIRYILQLNTRVTNGLHALPSHPIARLAWGKRNELLQRLEFFETVFPFLHQHETRYSAQLPESSRIICLKSIA